MNKKKRERVRERERDREEVKTQSKIEPRQELMNSDLKERMNK